MSFRLTGVTLNPKLSNLGVFLRSVLAVLHVAEVVLALDLVLMDVGEVVLRKLEGDRKEGVQVVEDLCVQ